MKKNYSFYFSFIFMFLFFWLWQIFKSKRNNNSLWKWCSRSSERLCKNFWIKKWIIVKLKFKCWYCFNWRFYSRWFFEYNFKRWIYCKYYESCLIRCCCIRQSWVWLLNSMIIIINKNDENKTNLCKLQKNKNKKNYFWFI